MVCVWIFVIYVVDLVVFDLVVLCGAGLRFSFVCVSGVMLRCLFVLVLRVGLRFFLFGLLWCCVLWCFALYLLWLFSRLLI